MKMLLFRDKTYSRWLILLIDQIIVSWTLFMSFLLLHKFEYIQLIYSNFLVYTLLYSVISVGVFVLMRIHTGIIRYSNTQDIIRIFMAVLATSAIFTFVSKVFFIPHFRISSKWFPEILTMNFFVSSSMLIMLRIAVKSLFFYVKTMEPGDKKENILIYGSGRDSILVKKALEAGDKNNLNVFAFVDDNPDKLNKHIEQKNVYHSKSIAALQHKFNIQKVLFVGDDLNVNGKKVTIDKCIELGIKVVTVPQSEKWLYGKLRANQIKDLKIEDLLHREPIVLTKNNILREMEGKRILITGAAGSIGSEIVRQIVGFNPEFVVLCDQAETPLHDLQLEIQDDFIGARTHIVMANIQNRSRMKAIFEEYQPQIIFHAAAYKHVPMMESNPSEAVLTNVLGTKNIADLAIEYEVEKFVMISTDKAVRPTNIMGASKRLAEMYIQCLNNEANLKLSTANNEELIQQPVHRTKFITTRFGNVLGSNGSVIPRFKAQIERGGPVAVTHPEITRYFMTIPESVQLVLEAAAMGNGGEIFIFDMGEPVKIVDLAISMIKLAGLIPDKDIKIIFTGLRPGEKLYEELLLVEEQTISTYHPKIKISKIINHSIFYVQNVIEELLLLNNSNNDFAMVKKMKEIIPDFKSKNSKYENIDQYIVG
ncbi:nucleoside-diphosphate sugar epimerase/dehydratase [Pedobacter gandavensis]|uniref:polysaccharide biosynthesis protein n=1 Tax=Pedobacter gandavensis TaxID=2679963 RepID=UPI00292DF299|nr:nucleoside-diphosphate sugar epimerase/dehydratase [Pedobacter gandavensis]